MGIPVQMVGTGSSLGIEYKGTEEMEQQLGNLQEHNQFNAKCVVKIPVV